MAHIKSSTPILDDAGNPATRRFLYAYRVDTGVLVGRGVSSDGSGDPHWSSVELLMLARGLQNGTSIGDWSARTKVLAATGIAKFSTTRPLDEIVSLSFAGGANGAVTSFSSGFNLGTGDFTIEGFARREGETLSNPAHDMCIWDMRSSGATSAPLIYFQGNDASHEIVYFAGSDRISGSTVAVDTDYHIELSRASGVSRLFLNGVLQGSSYADSGSYSSGQVTIGARYAEISSYSRGLNGYHGSFRLTKGVGRHTAAFTPPTRFSPFPSSLTAGNYEIDTGDYVGECLVVCLDDDGGAVYNHQILRTTPV